MNVFVLFIIILAVTYQNIFKKSYGLKVSGATYVFSTASVLFSIISMIIFAGGKFDFSSKETIVYSAAFAVFCTMCIVGTMKAIETGSLSLTTLIVSYSLLVPAAYSVMILNEKFTLIKFIGIIFLVISLFYVNYKKENSPVKVNIKWIIYVILAFVGNGMCSTVQRMQQIASGGLYQNEFMTMAYIISAVILTIFTFAFNKNKIREGLKTGSSQYILCGFANALTNMLVMYLAKRMPSSVMFPLISAGGILLTAFLSVVMFKEKLSLEQKKGLVFGVISVVFLNL